MLFVFVMFLKDYEYIVNKIHKAKRKSIHFSFIFYSLYLGLLPLAFGLVNIFNFIFLKIHLLKKLFHICLLG